MPRPMTMAEKILAAHAGLEEVVPGQLIECNLDLVLSNDVTAPIAIKEFKKIGVEKVFDPTKIALVPDHYVPNKDIKSAEQAKMTRDFAREALSTRFFPSKALWAQATLSSVPTATRAPMAHWAHFPPALVLPMLPWAMQPARHGSKFPKACCSTLKASFVLV